MFISDLFKSGQFRASQDRIYRNSRFYGTFCIFIIDYIDWMMLYGLDGYFLLKTPGLEVNRLTFPVRDNWGKSKQFDRLSHLRLS